VSDRAEGMTPTGVEHKKIKEETGNEYNLCFSQ